MSSWMSTEPAKKEMDDESDFTFCQVGLQGNEDDVGSPKAIPYISSIQTSDNPSSSASGNSISKESEADGSLTFKAVDMLPPTHKVIESLERLDVVDSFHGSQEQKAITRKPVARAKFLFEKGFSQIDWLKITKKHSDLAGLKGQSNRRLISMDEVKQHKMGESIWTVLKGRVYNITPYMKFHPGVVAMRIFVTSHYKVPHGHSGSGHILRNMRFSPGSLNDALSFAGVDMLMKAAGKDCTSLFNEYHAWVNAEFLLEKCLVGLLDDDR